MTILAQAAGPQRMGRVMSVIGVPMLLGPILGPILGGWLVDDVSLALDLLRQPAGRAVALVAGGADPADRDEPQPAPPARRARAGCCSRPGLAALVYGLAEIGVAAAASATPSVLVRRRASARVLLVAFVLHALRADAAR